MAKQIVIGNTYGRLTVIQELPELPSRQRVVLCRCVCGTEKAIRLCHLKRGAIRSCGCLIGETAKRIFTTHARRNTPEWYIWNHLKGRCLNPKDKDYRHYGGRGITVCERWRDSFATFFADMGPRPTPKHTIDRIDNDRGYEPGNCRWATRLQQTHNRRKR